MTTRTLIIGSRGSELALWQSRWVRDALQRLLPSLDIEIRIIKTTGDKNLDSPFSALRDKGLFTKELEHALLDGTIDLAVHSLKDVPTVIPDSLIIGAVCMREDVSDVFISHPARGYKRLADVPEGGAVATGSLRRRCQLLCLRPDLTIAEIRGNLNTRIDKLLHSQWDGMILARAGIVRLGRPELIAEVFSPTLFLPAVGQGALAVETRKNDSEVLPLAQLLDDPNTRRATDAERALLRRLEGGCQIPIGAYGRVENEQLFLDGMIGSLDGTRSVRSSLHGRADECERLGIALADELLARGGDAILEELKRASR